MGTAPKLVSCTVAIAVALAAGAPSAREYRSREVTREFQREHPCPSTGLRTSGACPGYRKDHVEPLACGGPDAVSNHAMANHPRCQGQGQVGAAGLRSLTGAGSPLPRR